MLLEQSAFTTQFKVTRPQKSAIEKITPSMTQRNVTLGYASTLSLNHAV